MALDNKKMFRYGGLGSEGATFGTAVDAEFHIDGISSTLDSPKSAEYTVPSGLSRAPRRKIRAYYAPTGTLEYPWDIETIGYNLMYALGPYVFTAAEAPDTINTHEFYGDDNIVPRYFTTRIGKDKFEHIFDGCAMNALTFNVGEGILNIVNDIVARRDTKDDLTAYDSLLLPTDVPMAFHNVTSTIGTGQGTDISAKVRTLNLAIRNNIDVNRGRNIGSEYPRRHRFGARAVEYSATLEFEDLNMLTAYWGAEDGPATIGSTFVDDFKITFAPHQVGATEENRKLEILLPQIDVKTSTISPRGSDALYHDISGVAYIDEVTLADAATKVNTEIYVKLLNNSAQYYVEA